MRAITLITSIIVATCCFTAANAASAKKAHTFEIANGKFVRDGKPTHVYSGEMHFSRVPAEYWRHRMKMMKAMGLNAVATYVFWNYHEVAPGVWDWTTGNKNIRQFIKTAQEEDLMVILRPGPYGCGEWEFGGYPWWLPTTPGLEVRTMNQQFLDSCKCYINQLADQVRDLQVTKGGPIVMVQVENEFGSYVAQRKDIPLETHKKYNSTIHQYLIEAGFDAPFFTSDGSWLFEGGSIAGVLPTANGESNVDNLKKVVNEYHNGVGPYMVAEFYPGWLDHWNEPFQKVSTNSVVKQLKKYLQNDVDFNIYMVHGGTNFAFTSGANYNTPTNIQPDLTSYDYNAPISEAGWRTEKYDSIRAAIQQHLNVKLPPVPEPIPTIEIPSIALSKAANLLPTLLEADAVESDTPLTFEQLKQGHGYVLYSRHFNQPISGLMKVPGIADYAIVYVNDQPVGELNRVTSCDSLMVDIPFNSTVHLLVENFGRINYGSRITQNDKGIIAPITIDGNEIEGNWEMRGLPMSEMPREAAFNSPFQEGMPTVYFGKFNLKSVGDTFINMEDWGKGIVFVNGYNLGRYWKVGPQQTLYLQGCWLKEGDNEIVIFEQIAAGPQKTTISTLKTPVLEKLKKQK